MKLDEYELDYVKYFVQVKGYHEYEVLAEILDHFILLLEDRRKDYPNIPFEDLVDDTYEKVGKSIFEEISISAKKSLRRKYFRALSKQCLSLLHYKYLILMVGLGILLYYLQSWIHYSMNYPETHFSGIMGLSKYLLVALVSGFVKAPALSNLKYLSNKLARWYGCALIVGIFVLEAFMRLNIQPNTFGFESYYAMSSAGMVIELFLLYAIVATAKTINKESEDMEKGLSGVEITNRT